MRRPFPAIVAAVRPRLIVLNNLFRDQLDRYGELNSVATMWGAALAALDAGATLVYDADDPTLCTLAGMCAAGHDARAVRLGRARLHLAGTDARGGRGALPDMRRRTRLSHALRRASGRLVLPDWGQRPPAARLHRGADSVCPAWMGRRSSYVTTRGESFPVEAQVPGLYNVYNVLGASAAARTLGVPAETIRTHLARLRRAVWSDRARRVARSAADARAHQEPDGRERSAALVPQSPRPPRLLICINDLVADGRDVSWLWDTDFESLADYPAPIIVSGIRALDMAVRLEVRGRAAAIRSPSFPNIGDALIAVAEQAEPGADAYVLPDLYRDARGARGPARSGRAPRCLGDGGTAVTISVAAGFSLPLLGSAG